MLAARRRRCDGNVPVAAPPARFGALAPMIVMAVVSTPLRLLNLPVSVGNLSMAVDWSVRQLACLVDNSLVELCAEFLSFACTSKSLKEIYRVFTFPAMYDESNPSRKPVFCSLVA
ncbi:unnamed protein product [Soboliphyme baturini]|uniref:Secreted protein n=1 Tax=Soboliphyme baturini TaxID=241478 RepID=A0A183IAZ3_9BILA|nr:unnamed protein product [Soboliphyme baturini]